MPSGGVRNGQRARPLLIAPRAPTSRLRLVALLHCSASLDCLFRRSLDGSGPGQRGIDLLDRPAPYFDSPDKEGEPGDNAPGRKVVHRRFDGRKCSFWKRDVARADDQRQAEWTDDLAEIAEPVAEPHATAAQGRRPHLRRIRPDDCIAAIVEESLSEQHQEEHRYTTDERVMIKPGDNQAERP